VSDGHTSDNNSESFILFKQSCLSRLATDLFPLSLSDHHALAGQKGLLQGSSPVVSLGHFVIRYRFHARNWSSVNFHYRIA